MSSTKHPIGRLDHSVQCFADLIRELVMVRERLLILSDRAVELAKMTYVRLYRVRQKSSPLIFIAVFSATALNLNAKFYTHV